MRHASYEHDDEPVRTTYKVRYFVLFGHLPMATRRPYMGGDAVEITKEEYKRRKLERDQAQWHTVRAYLDWDTFQALKAHAKANKLEPRDMINGIITAYYQVEKNKETRWGRKH
jgi:hypothetical protein